MGELGGANPYALVHNSPNNGVDRLGLIAVNGCQPSQTSLVFYYLRALDRTLNTLVAEMRGIQTSPDDFATVHFNVFAENWGYKWDAEARMWVADRPLPTAVNYVSNTLSMMKRVMDTRKLNIWCACEGDSFCTGSVDAYCPKVGKRQGIVLCPKFWGAHPGNIVRQRVSLIAHELSHYATAHATVDYHLTRPEKLIYDAHAYQQLFLDTP
ncbi:MAG: hypothetical protein A3K19_16190 [Lentisphaerae bacterium RIFOXYB12_FULL_65_16]|nr:MAG: hypothetical protein A3K18_24725 [Lentisphaerae bacterium RIFOXYA12_64_32]OGV92571.1 MAG: hypothetical protein A3K19_16190 [Lentisphaerae bacterium RIFOXYB12_FULL_65_16]